MPYHSPNANARAERFTRSIEQGVSLDRILRPLRVRVSPAVGDRGVDPEL